MRNTHSGSYYSPSLLLGWLLQERGIYHEGEGTASGGGSGDGGTSGGNGGTGDPKTAPPADTGNGEGGDGGQGSGDPSKTPADKDDKGKGKEPITFTPEQHNEINRIVKKAKADEAERLKKQAELDAAKAKGDFERLYSDTQTELATLKPKAELADRLTGLIHTQVDGEVKDWPEEVKASDPGRGTDEKPVSVEDRLRWVETHRELAKKLSTGPDPLRHNHGGGTGVKPQDQIKTGTSFRRPGKPAK